MILVTGLIALWALRLSIYIFIRHKEEDWRYKEMRERWEKSGAYYIRAYLTVFVLQSVFSLINNASAIYVNLYSVQ